MLKIQQTILGKSNKICLILHRCTLTILVNSHHDVLLPGNSSKSHVPLLKRPTSDSVETKMEKSMKKARCKL